jgi:hypothetical protein
MWKTMRSSFLGSAKPIVVSPTTPLKIHILGFEDAVDERAIPHVAYTIQTVMDGVDPHVVTRRYVDFLVLQKVLAGVLAVNARLPPKAFFGS